MPAISKLDAVNIVNSVLVNNINREVVWGTNNMPEGALPAWFAGATTAPPIGAANTTQDWVNGSIRGQPTEDVIRYVTTIALYALKRQRIIIYFQGNGYRPAVSNVNSYHAWTEVQYDGNNVGWWASGYNPDIGGANPAFNMQRGLVEQSDMNNFAVNMLNDWYARARDVVTGTLTNTVCHYSCHGNCHSNRGRR